MLLENKEQFEELNSIAIAVLEELGNQNPSQEQIDLVENVLKSIQSRQGTAHAKRTSL
jgi:hypothetical protein